MLRFRLISFIRAGSLLVLSVALVSGALLMAPGTEAALIDRVNEAFRGVHGRNPTVSEWTYWAGRVQRKEKASFADLYGAIAYQRAHQGGSPAVVTNPVAVSAGSGWELERHFYASPHNPNFLPEGTLISSPSTADVYVVTGGQKSLVISNVLNRWLSENHFFKGNIVITIPDTDFGRYPTAPAVNHMYVGKVLRHPNGAQFFIDDKLRKRPLSSSVRSALKIPAGNLYGTSALHLQQFRTGPAVSSSKIPGGFTMYDGPYHGGRLWKTTEVAGGIIEKNLYLKDRFYEADGRADESERAPVSVAQLASVRRGPNVDRYPNGWVIGIGSDIYVMQDGKRRLVTSPQLFAAMGYSNSHVRREYPDLYKQLAQGHPIRAFKGIAVNGTAGSRGAPQAAPTTASHLQRVRPHVRALIADMNGIYRSVFDREVSVSENQFWVDYVYSGEVDNKTDLVAAMKRAKVSGNKPSKTNRNATLSAEVLKRKWFPYLFYFTHQKEPSEDDKQYWYSRIASDRDSVAKLGATIQWLKDTHGMTRR